MASRLQIIPNIRTFKGVHEKKSDPLGDCRNCRENRVGRESKDLLRKGTLTGRRELEDREIRESPIRGTKPTLPKHA